MRKRASVLVLILFSLCFLREGFSQSDSTSIDEEAVLNLATEEFNAGHFYGIPSMLDPVMRRFTREQQQRAHLLLVQTYLITDDPIGAKRNYLEVLKANPEYQTDERYDPIDLVYLSKKFTAAPIFSVFGSLGLNAEPVRVVYSVFQGENEKKKYILKPGFKISGGIDWNIKPNLILSGEIGYSYTSFTMKGSGLFKSTGLNPITDLVILEDHQHWFDLPLTIKYIDTFGKYRPYGYVGYATSLLLGDRVNLSIADNTPPDVSDVTGGNTGHISTETGESLPRDLKSIRTMFQRSFLVGGGMRIKWNLNYLFADVRYSFGQTLFGTGKYFPEAIYDYGYADDYFRLDRLSITGGFLWPLYKPRELKKAKTKGVLRRIQKNN